ncbi:hypothetical protein EJB05_57678, partial [Eragrostis curvula]
MARPRRRGSRRCAPPELRLAYGARARPLGRAVLSLLPPPLPPGEPCPACRSSAGCLACRRWAHLLRDGDPVAYRRLVTRAVCAVTPAGAAPPPPRYTPGNAGHSQAKLVRETIKSIMTDQSGTTNNVLCVGCRKGGQSSCVGDLVSSSSWDILLHRIGDLLMCYILRYSSIFLSVKKNDYIQVAGRPLNAVLQRPIFASATARNQQPHSKKEKGCTCYMWGNTKIAPNLSGDNCVYDSNIGFCSSDASTCKFDALQSSENYCSARTTKPNCSTKGCNYSKFHSISKSTICSSLYSQNPRKRKRLYSWQRLNKQRKICCEDGSAIEWSKINSSDFNASAKVSDEVHYLEPALDTDALTMSSDAHDSQIKEPYGVAVSSSEMSSSSVFDIRPSQGPCGCSTPRCQPACPQVGPPSFQHLNSSSICFNCLILNSSKYLSVDSLIPRHTIFYNRRTSYNVFHGKHILNRRKRPDALSLIKHIFGIKGCCAKFLKFVSHETTATNSNCSCFCLLTLMKNLIRNSRRCQYKKLFLKHCTVKSKVATNVVNNDRKAKHSVGGKSSYFDQFAQLEAYSTHQQVVSFVWAVLTRIVPEPLLGNSNSKRSLRIIIWKFIELRRFETFHLCDCIGELKVSDYSWISNIRASCFCSALLAREIRLSNGSDEQKHMNLLRSWINWLFSDIVIPLVQAYFYVTERESRRYDVFYYPKPLSSGGGILVDQGKTSTIQKKEVQRLLCEQVRRNILKIGQNFYLQEVGIAQGSKLSPNLCSLYYGHLENSVLSKFLHDGEINSGEDVSAPKSLLMRFIDDFLFVSFSKKHALDFFNRMRRGFVYYNCYMNDRKYGFNFEVANSEHCCNRLYRGDDGFCFIPWSGLLINCESLEIQADYTRYMHSLIIRRTQDAELLYSVRPVLKLKRKETMWLGLSAYLRVLQKKQSRYKDLMALLTAEIGRYGHLDHNSDSLRYAVDDSHSSIDMGCDYKLKHNSLTSGPMHMKHRH